MSVISQGMVLLAGEQKTYTPILVDLPAYAEQHIDGAQDDSGE